MTPRASKPIFTEYVRSLAPSSTAPLAYPPGELLERLGRILRAQMRRRGLWRETPRFLGRIYEVHASWADPGAFDDLLWDCFMEVIFSRRYLRRLKARADAPGGNIEGMISLNVGRFLTEHQKGQDPYGYAVFQNLKGAVLLALASGAIETKGGDDGVVVAGTLLAPPGTEDGGAEPVAISEDDVQAWCGDLTSRLCATRKAVQRELAARFPRLGERCRLVFSFKSLVTPTKKVVRPHCLAVDERALAEAWGDGKVSTDPEELARLEIAVARAIAGLDKPARIRKRLETLWTHYVELARESEGDHLPSRNEVRRGLPGVVAKSTFNDDLGVLGGIVRRIHGSPADVGVAALLGSRGESAKQGRNRHSRRGTS